MLNNAVPDSFDDSRELVCSDMGMGIDKNRAVSSEVHELIEDFPYVSPLGRTGEKFSVREGTGPTFTIAVVGIRIHLSSS